MQFIYVILLLLKIVVLPELSNPIIIIFNYFFPFNFENTVAKIDPIIFLISIIKWTL